MKTYSNVKGALPLQLTFLIFAMLLNSIGVIILQLSDTTADYKSLGFLEAFKDLPIALVSAFSVNYISRFGFKKALIAGLLLSAISCFLLPFVNSLWFIRIWLSLIGISFAISKIAVFSILKFLTSEEMVFTKFMNRIEASFMIGIFLVNIGFGLLLSSPYADFWKFGFWFIGLLCIVAIALLKPLVVSESKQETVSGINFSVLLNKGNLVFFILIFLVVYTEQSFNSWMPTFYKHVLGSNSFFALQSIALFALFSFVGRIVTSKIIHRYSWFRYIFTCLSVILLILILSQVLMFHYKTLILFMLPVIGLFTAPLYPLLNSRFLSRLKNETISTSVALVVIFSSIGGSLGSFVMSQVFHGQLADFYPMFIIFPILLMALIFIGFFYFSK